MNLDTLFDAAITGDADARAKLEMQADKLGQKGYPILHVEAQKGNAERVRFILREFAHKNVLTKLTLSKHTALHWAVYRGHTEVAEVLIDAARDLPPCSFQAFLRQADDDMNTALHAAVMYGHVAIVKLIVEADPTDTHIQNDDGKTPMYIAVEEGYNDMVEIISTTCTAPSLDGPYGDTVVRIDDPDQVKRPAGGTLYKIKDRYAFYDAAIAGVADAIAKLEMQADKLYYDDETILHMESRRGKTKCVRFLLKEFANKNLLVKLNTSKQTALHLAVYNGHTEVAKVLIDAATHLPNHDTHDITCFQSFLRQGDCTMNTALHYAVKEGHLDIVKLLVEADQDDRHIENSDGKTPIYIAAENGYFKIVKLICSTCRAPSLDGPGGSTALHAAISNIHHRVLKEENIDVIRMLIEKAKNQPTEAFFDGIDDTPVTSFQAFLRQGDCTMNTALHCAAENGHVDIVKLLVEADPTDRHSQNFFGKTPIYIAAEKGFNHIVEIICTTCTAPSLDGPGGTTALHFAISNIDKAKRNDKDVIRMIINAAKRSRTPQADAPHESFEALCTSYDIHDNPITSFQAFLRQGDQNGDTALHMASYYGHTEVVEVLIEAARNLPPSSSANDDINPVTSFQAFLRQGDKNMNTALHLAVQMGHVDIVKLFVEADPTDRHSQNVNGKTPIYIAAERGYFDMVKIMCTTCRVPIHLDGPGSTTALHPVIKNFDKDKKEERDLIRLIINAVKIVNIPEDAENFLTNQINWERNIRLVQLFKKTDEDRCTILELAVVRNYGDVVELILAENPAYQRTYFRGGRLDHDMVGLLPLIYQADDKGYRDVLELLNQRFKTIREVSFSIRNMDPLLSAIRSHNLETVLRLLDKNDTKFLVNFIDDVGWTALHHAAYHEFNEVIKPIVEAQKKFGYDFVYPHKRPTPLHVAAQKGFTSTVILLLQLWPSSSSAYIDIDKDGQNILHLAVLQSKKETVQAILKYCPEEYKKELVNKQDNNGNTPLHVLIRRGCLVPELFRYQGLDKLYVKNDDGWTPPDMLYVEDEIIDDQVQIKIALDHIQIDHKRHIFSSSVLSIAGKRERKDVNFKKRAQQMIDEKLERMKGDIRAVANYFASAITGEPISRAALEIESDTLNEAGETLLHIESKKGVIENVRFIVSKFENKNLLVKLDNQNQTALYHAAHHGHIQVVEVLVKAARHLPSSSFQDFIRQTDGQMGNTALHLAVLKGNVAIVKLLVQADPNDNHVQNKEGKTPIYIAAENGYKDIVQEICTTCTALSVDGPGGRTTALHALIQNIGQEGASDVIRNMVDAAKSWSSADFEALFSKTDEAGRTVLQLAVEKNDVDAVRVLILDEDPACQPGREIKRNALMLLMFKAINNEYNVEIVKLLSQTYEIGINPDHKDVVALILAIQRHDEDCVSRLLGAVKQLVTFTDDNGWTPLHYAAYHEFDSMLDTIIKLQKDVKHPFVYENMVATPLHVAVENGYTSTLIRLMELWPADSSSEYSPYTVVNEYGRNILHLASAADNRKEMVQGILKYCPDKYKDQILKQKDTINDDTPLHLLFRHGCHIPKVIKHQGLDTMAKNRQGFTPRDMLYVNDDIVGDQVHIKMALDNVQTNQPVWKLWGTEKKTNIWKSNKLTPSKRKKKDEKFDERKQLLMKAQQKKKKEDLEKYKMRTNTQIIVSALITTVAFTVGFTMPGGLYQSGDVNQGMVLFSTKSAFRAFMVSDALALLLSTSSLFFYFLESMNEDPRQVPQLNAASTALNIVSLMAMMVTFIAGTYVVLSRSPALAITVSVIGSLFFLLIIALSIKILYDRNVKRNED